MYEENLGCIGPCHVVDVSIKRKERALSVCRFRLMAFVDRNTSGGVVQEHKQSIISRVQIEMLELLYASRGKSSVLSANRVNYKAASSKAKGDIFIFQERKNQLQLLFFSGLGGFGKTRTGNKGHRRMYLFIFWIVMGKKNDKFETLRS